MTKPAPRRKRSPARGRTKPLRTAAGRGSRAASAQRNLGGRPRSKLPDESIARLGAPPLQDPLALGTWANALLGEVAWLCAIGKLDRELASSLRASATAMQRTIPAATDAAIERFLRDEADAITADDLGPTLETGATNGARKSTPIRRDPR